MFSLKAIIWSLMPASYNRADEVISDEQIYLETLAEQMDEDSIAFIIAFISNVSNYKTIVDRLVPIAEAGFYKKDILVTDAYLQKKLLSEYAKIITHKGSIYSYELFFRLIGFDVQTKIPAGTWDFKDGEHYYVSGSASGYITLDGVDEVTTGTKWLQSGDETRTVVYTNAQLERMTVVEEVGTGGTFDSIYTFDSEERTLDSDNSLGYGYWVELYGGYSLGDPLLYDVFKIIEFLEPIDARLLGVRYNGDDLSRFVMRVYIDSEGDLIYDNSADPTTTFSLDSSGNLIVNGPNAHLYTLDADGNLWLNA